MKKMMCAVIAVLFCVGLACGNAAFDQNKALRVAGTANQTGVLDLSGVSSNVFDFAEFQTTPLGNTRLTFEQREWMESIQGVDENSSTSSMNEFINAEVPPV
jgi:hypothetical protein